MPKCHSTNDIARDLVSNQQVPEGSLIITDHQTKGKGQRGNAWYSGKNQNITMSIVLNPSFLPINSQFKLNMMVSLAITDTIAQTVPDKIKIKWPNDICFNSRKLAGILIENSVMGNQIKSAIVGIGINVNQLKFPLGLNAISLAEIINRPLDLQALTGQLCEQIEKRYFQIRSGHDHQLQADYYDRLLGYRSPRQFKSEHIFSGIIQGVDKSGKLLIESDQGLQSFGMKEIQFIM